MPQESPIFFVEVWRPKDRWRDLSTAERGAYVERLMTFVRSVLDETIEVVAWSMNCHQVAKRSDFTYFAGYVIKSRRSFERLKEAIRESGWYEYFDQVEYAGDAEQPGPILQNLIGAGK